MEHLDPNIGNIGNSNDSSGESSDDSSDASSDCSSDISSEDSSDDSSSQSSSESSDDEILQIVELISSISENALNDSFDDDLED
jgi:hypothetical protein